MVTGITDNEVLAQLARLDRAVLAKVRLGAEDANYEASEPSPVAYAHAPENAKGTEALQLEWERKEAVQAITAELEKLHSIAPDAAGEFRSQLAQVGSALSIKEIRTLKTDIVGAIQKAIEFAATDRNLEDFEGRESAKKAGLQKLIADLRQYDLDTQETRDHLRGAGYGDEEYDKKLKALQVQLDKVKEGSPEWHQLRDRMLELDGNYFSKVETQANQNGDTKIEQDAAEAKRKAWEMREKNSIQERAWKEKAYGQEETMHQQSALSSLSDDDPPTETKKQSQEIMAVVDANHNEIEAPSGGKGRSAGRTQVK